jgi:AraC-like DNA-binding protein/mannose-6-phosphate isomerase-like protein (cupin superfamily)
MLAWSPILIQKIEIQALGFVLRKLQLNRHRDTEVSAHAHDFAQLILYLSGEGRQTIRGRRQIARTGDLFVIPPGTPHGFALQGRSRPLCLVLDYELEGPGRVRAGHRRLAPETLNELHALLARVPPKGRLTLCDYPAILAVVARLLEPDAQPPPALPSLFEKLREPLRSPAPLGRVARTFGYHPDHLSRKLKRESGLGLRALRDRLRLEAAQRALRTTPTVAEAAMQCGFEDPNYFARWFRRQTGQTPQGWRR